jgi:hypothetical protein
MTRALLLCLFALALRAADFDLLLRNARIIHIAVDHYPCIACATSLGATLPNCALNGGQGKLLARLKDPAQVRGNATFANPHPYSTGFTLVLVNGKIAVENDQLSPERGGQVIRRTE